MQRQSFFLLSTLLFISSSIVHGYGIASPFNANAILFSGNANIALAQGIAKHLGVPLGNAQIGRFNDGEIQICIEDNVRNKDVFVIHI